MSISMYLLVEVLAFSNKLWLPIVLNIFNPAISRSFMQWVVA